MELKEKVLEFRAKHNLTQKQLAQIVGVASNTVYRLECDICKTTKRNEAKFKIKMKEWEEKKNVSL